MTTFQTPAELYTDVRTGRHGGRSARSLAQPGDLFHCARCGQDKPVEREGSGFATDGFTGSRFTCYACCADIDREYMREHGRITLYLSGHELGAEITNWPGTLRFPVVSLLKFNHPFVRGWAWCGAFRTDDGTLWRFKNIGDSQIAHCRKARSV